MSEVKIPLTKPYITQEDFEWIKKPLTSGWLTQGKLTEEFEHLIANYTGAKEAIAVSSCTTALYLCLEACGVKEGDEVLLPSFTFVATANVIEHRKAIPVFCDINLDDFNISPEEIERKITKKTKAIICVHQFGMPADMDKICEIIKDKNITLIEDCACSLGSFYNGLHTGRFGLAGAFSFHPRKLITTGEGGMIITDDKEIADKLRIMRSQGAVTSDYVSHLQNKLSLPDFVYAGYNFRITDIQAALGIAQFKKFEFILKERKRCAEIYSIELKNLPLRLPVEKEKRISNYQSYVVLLENEKIRDKLALFLIKHGISVRIGTHAIHTLSYYKEKYGLKPEDLRNSLKAEKCSLTLPIYAGMGEEQYYVIVKIKEFFTKFG